MRATVMVSEHLMSRDERAYVAFNEQAKEFHFRQTRPVHALQLRESAPICSITVTSVLRGIVHIV
jgi:hypothetical protein